MTGTPPVTLPSSVPHRSRSRYVLDLVSYSIKDPEDKIKTSLAVTAPGKVLDRANGGTGRTDAIYLPLTLGSPALAAETAITCPLFGLHESCWTLSDDPVWPLLK